MQMDTYSMNKHSHQILTSGIHTHTHSYFLLLISVSTWIISLTWHHIYLPSHDTCTNTFCHMTHMKTSYHMTHIVTYQGICCIWDKLSFRSWAICEWKQMWKKHFISWYIMPDCHRITHNGWIFSWGDICVIIVLKIKAGIQNLN